jgi:hypothetical protein
MSAQPTTTFQISLDDDVLRVDLDTENADWPKRTDDRLNTPGYKPLASGEKDGSVTGRSDGSVTGRPDSTTGST